MEVILEQRRSAGLSTGLRQALQKPFERILGVARDLVVLVAVPVLYGLGWCGGTCVEFATPSSLPETRD